MTDIHEMDATDLARTIAAGELSRTEVLEHTLERAERLGPGVGAFAHLTPDHARAQVAAQEAAGPAGAEPAGRFAGVPCPIKDLTMVEGLPFEAGSAALRGYIAPVDDGIVRRLAAAGTVMVGKTTTPELGLPPYTEPDVAPPARNPWDTRRSAGGSSGGAAAAVAAGIVPVAHGSDGGGSIRIPASVCGLVGLKASRGRVSPGPVGVDGAALATQGVLTRSVRDTAAFLDIVSEPWPGDFFALPRPASFAALAQQRPPRLRIGVLVAPINDADAPVHESSLAAVDRATSLLESLGHEVVATTVPFTPEEWEAFRPLWAVGALSAPVPPEAEELLVPLTRWMREQGRAYDGVAYAAAVGAVQRLGRSAARTWHDLDVVLTPTLAQPAPLIGAMRDDADPAADFEAQKAFTPWSSVWNITGAPAISVPLHRAEVDGVELPVGVQLGGVTLGQEGTLLALAAQLEDADPWPHATGQQST